VSANGAQAHWDAFAEVVAEVADCDPAALRPEMRLIADLGLDSLALAELITALVLDFDMESLARDLDDRQWELLTLGELHEEQRTGVALRPDFDVMVPL
jgi:acyl carrier protein